MQASTIHGRGKDQLYRIWRGLDPVPVTSSNVKSVGYDQATNTFFVSFLNGSTYAYEVPAEIATGVFTNGSFGKAVWDILRGADGQRPIRMLDIDRRWPYLRIE